MRYKLLAGAALATVLAASGAFAQGGMWQNDGWRPDHGWYGAIDLGGHKTLPIDLAVTPTQSGDGDGFSARTNLDWDGFVRLGYRISPHFRIELEGGYRHGGLDSFQDFKTPIGNDVDVCATGTADPSCAGPGGSVNAWTGMANILIDVFPHWRISPSTLILRHL